MLAGRMAALLLHQPLPQHQAISHAAPVPRRSLDFASAGRNPLLRTGLELLSLPFFVAACDMPQAVGLYWLANSSAHYMLQRVSSRPAVAKALGLPLLLVQPTTKKEAEGEAGGDRAAPHVALPCSAGCAGLFAGADVDMCWYHTSAAECCQGPVYKELAGTARHAHAHTPPCPQHQACTCSW